MDNPVVDETLMPFWDHMYELRKRILIILALLLPAATVSYLFFPVYIGILYQFLGEQLYATQITEGFLMRMKISLLSGGVIVLPGFIFQLVLFIFPALEKKQKRSLLSLIIIVFLLFIVGVVFAFESVLPISIRFLKSASFFPDSIERLISYSNFVAFFFQFLIGFGLCFQFPVILVFLIKTGAITTGFLLVNFKYFIAIILLISALLTPPDIISQVLLAFPMIILYGLSIFICRIMGWGE